MPGSGAGGSSRPGPLTANDCKTDLEWFDLDRGDTGWDGKYLPQSFADGIQLNEYYLRGYSSGKRRGVASHELGHALGPAHSYAGQVMVDNSVSRGAMYVPQSHEAARTHMTDRPSFSRVTGFCSRVTRTSSPPASTRPRTGTRWFRSGATLT